MRRLVFLLVAGVRRSLARAPGTDEEAEVGGTYGAVAVDVALRIVGAPGADEDAKVSRVDRVVPAVHVGPTVVAPGFVIVAAAVDERAWRIDLAAFRERAVEQGRTAGVDVAHPVASVVGRVAGERAVGQDRTAEGVVHPAAAVGRVARKRAVGQGRTAEGVVHPAAIVSRVARERAVGQGRTAGVVEHPSAIAYG